MKLLGRNEQMNTALQQRTEEGTRVAARHTSYSAGSDLFAVREFRLKRKPDAALQISESRVRTQRVELRINF